MAQEQVHPSDDPLVVGYVYANAQFKILPQYLDRFPMGVDQELRLRQCEETRLARKNARSKAQRQEKKARSGAGGGGTLSEEDEPILDHAIQGLARKAPRSHYDDFGESE